MNTVAIVQARMGSSRLPGKVMRRLADHTVLAHVILRLQAVNEIDQIVVATTALGQDDEIVQESLKYGVHVYRGSEQDVLSRYYEAAVESEADTIVRITSDCPLIDPEVTGDIIRYYFAQNVDYASNSIQRTFPRGLDTEVFSMQALKKAHESANQPEQREHVTPYLYQQPAEFKLAYYTYHKDYSTYRWTLDTIEDWKLIEEIYGQLYIPGEIFSWGKVLELLKQQPALFLLNQHIEQKKLGE